MHDTVVTLLLGATVLSCLTICVENKAANIVLHIPITGQNELLFREGDNPCKVVKKYCKRISSPKETCFNQLHSSVLTYISPAWSEYKPKLRIDASFFIDCNTQVLKTPMILMDPGDQNYRANQTDTVQDMLRLLERAMQKDTEALSTFNGKRNELKLSDIEKLELYREAVLLLPNNLFIVDQLGLALLFLNQEPAARTLWTNAVNRGLWENSLQRPVSRYVKGLTSKPWYNTGNYRFISLREAGYTDVRNELLYNLEARPYIFTEETENLHIGGRWTELRLKSSSIPIILKKP